MNKLYQPCTLLLCLLISFGALAQTGEPVKFAVGDYLPSNNVSLRQLNPAQLQKTKAGNHYYVLLQFNELPGERNLQLLKNEGIVLGDYLPGKAWLASVPVSFNFSLAQKWGIGSIDELPAFYKTDPAIAGFAGSSRDDVYVMAVQYFTGAHGSLVANALDSLGAMHYTTAALQPEHTFLLQVNPGIAPKIAALPFVSSVSLVNIKDKSLNYNSIAAHGASVLNASGGKNLNGRGVVVGVGDNADIASHLDFTGRLINRTATIAANHGTHVAGTVTGAGIIDPVNRGFASKARVVNQYFSDVIAYAPSYVFDYDMVATNNSYHSAASGCAGTGAYNTLSNFADRQMRTYPQLLHVFASGNDGGNTCNGYPSFFATIKTGWQVSKNVLTVGAIKAQDYTNAGFSSRGPVRDGRLKPEITTAGWATVSTYVNNTYGANWGTSMAAPAATGGSLLVIERYRQLFGGANPRAGLVKALLCNTAEDLGNPGPDFTFGFGMMNVRRAVQALDSNRFFISSISNGANNQHTIQVPANTQRLKIMLYWPDTAAAVNAAVQLVNDLDLTITAPGNITRRPLVLNPAAGSVNNAAAEGTDRLNNIEQVDIATPVPGTYTIRVNGFAVPFGPQEYVICYDIIPAHVTVDFPAGGETLVPGETATIRWTAAGDNSNSFTVAYSEDNGNNWTTINNNVAAGARLLDWVVPANATNAALIRVSRNNSSLSGSSSFNFSILNQPNITATPVCEGALRVNWRSITSATSYDVLLLTADSMRVVGNTSDTSFIITGLDKSATHWVSVAAKNGSTAGRRSVAVSVSAASGPCTLALFNNDVKADLIQEPTTARQFFSNAAQASRPVKIVVKNLGTTPVNGPMNVSYSYNGNAPVTEVLNGSIAAGGTIVYTFSTMYPVLVAGYNYQFKAWVTHNSDNIHANDTAYKNVSLINNDAITALPLADGFETMPEVEQTIAGMAVGGNKYLDFNSNSSRGRARSFVNSGFALSGNRALTLDQRPFSELTNVDSLTLNYNLSAQASNQMRFDFFYKNHGQTNNPNNRIWIRGSENDAWVEAFNLYENQADLGGWVRGIININDVLQNAAPPQSMTATFQIKIGQEGNTSANNPFPVIDYDDGYTFDNLLLSRAQNDVAVLAVNSPDKGGCALGSKTPVSIKIKNYHNATLNNLQVSYRVNNGTIFTDNISSIGASQTIDYTFNQDFDFSAFIDYNITVWVKFTGDTYSPNDSIINYNVHNSPVISSFPYLETFESNNGFYFTKGKSSSWAWGTPAKSLINKAANGTRAWVTNLTGNYNDNETSYLITPCFNLSSLQRPVLSFSHNFEIEQDYDFTWVEYSADGTHWFKLGNANEGTNWYDNTIERQWVQSNSKWHVASISLPAGLSSVRFRFAFSSDVAVSEEGVGIDDVRIHEAMPIAGDNGIVYGGSYNGTWGNGWVPIAFGTPGINPWGIIAEINSNGQNLGTVSVQPYQYIAGPVRFTGSEYYLDKNFVITSTNTPTAPVGIRLYITEAEARRLMTATGCTGCGKPSDPYELGVTQYSGSSGEENGTLNDNFNGFYRHITPANTLIYPHGNGYYAECSVNSFSELWLGKGIVAPPANLSCAASAKKYGAPVGSSYQWQANTGSGFQNLANNSNFNGTDTDTLIVTGLPTSSTGTLIRCVVDGLPGEVYTIRFGNQWTGAANTNWFDTANWSCATLPDEFTDVIIPAGLSRYPLVNANASVRTVRILNGATVTVSTGAAVEVKGK